MTLKGFTGKLLDIDLTTMKIEKIPLDEKIAEKFLGGAGYACAYLLPKLTKETDPLGPANILMFMTGPLCGTLASSTGRMAVCAKSPYSGIWGESNSGSDICVQLKKAGYDGVIIRGAAAFPMFIEIHDDIVELRDAAGIWGRKISEVEELLKVYPQNKNAKVMAIGPAGENKVKFAIIGSQERSFGRTGMGAVMGSKNLKAIVISGTKKIELANSEGLKEFVKETNKNLMEITTNVIMRDLGTSSSLDMYNINGELPVKYFRKEMFPEDQADKISGATLSETFLKKNRHCFSCPIGCGRVVEVGDNDLGLPSGLFEGPEYETIAGFGSLMMNSDMKQILKANYLCNELGLDTISTSSVIAFLMDIKEQGKISPKDLDGIELSWGNMDGVFQLMEKLSTRAGIGNILADGSIAVGKKYGISRQQIAAIGNIEITYHDMRAINGMSLAYGISPHYGGSHNACDMYMNGLGMSFDELGIESNDPKENSPKIGQMAARLMNHRALYSSIIMCVFCNPSTDIIAKYLELGIGKTYSVEDLKLMGERIHQIKRLFNLKMGHTPTIEEIPEILRTPLPTSGQEGNVPEFPMLKKAFYDEMGWDITTGYPSQEKLALLGLESFVSK